MSDWQTFATTLFAVVSFACGFFVGRFSFTDVVLELQSRVRRLQRELAVARQQFVAEFEDDFVCSCGCGEVRR